MNTKVTHVVKTSTGLTFTYQEAWAGENKADDLMKLAGELNVPYTITRERLTTEEDGETKVEVLSVQVRQ